MNKKILKCKEITCDEDYKKFLKKIAVCDILKITYELSKDMVFKDNLTRFMVHKFNCISNYKNDEGKCCVQPWLFSDLIYNSICYSNDYKDHYIIDDYAKYIIITVTEAYDTMKKTNSLNNISTQLDANLFLFGFGGEQFKYQEQYKVKLNLMRELYILFSITKKRNTSFYPAKVVKEEIGVDWRELITVLLCVLFHSLFCQEVTEAINYINFDSSYKEDIFNKVVDYYTTDYNEVRSSALGRQIFYVKPFIKTQKNKILTSSTLFNWFIIEHAIFWIIRNYYRNKPKNEQQTFTNEFGYLFENYFEELLTTYNINHDKIPETNRNRADWHLIIGDYNILIEQKSAILPINIKQQESNLKLYNNEIKKIVYKAIKQLNVTEKDLSIDNPIKIILCYDDYIVPNILPSVFAEYDSNLINDGRCFIVNILEMEIFLELASKDYNLFDKVMKDWLNSNDKSGHRDCRLLKILKDHNCKSSSYWNSPVFDEYKQILIDTYNDFMNIYTSNQK